MRKAQEERRADSRIGCQPIIEQLWVYIISKPNTCRSVEFDQLCWLCYLPSTREVRGVDPSGGRTTSADGLFFFQEICITFTRLGINGLVATESCV